MLHGTVYFEPVRSSDHFVDRAKAELGHMLAHLLGDHAHEVDDVGRIAGEFRAQLGILRRHTHRTGVEMTYPHHDAAERHQCRGGESELLGAEQRRDHHVAASFQLAVGFNRDAAAQIVQHQSLMGFGQTQFPGQTGMLDAGLRRCAGAAVVAADQDDIRMAFRDAGRDGADADLGHQLDADARVMIGVLEIVDQLRQIFDGINIMVRRR